VRCPTKTSGKEGRMKEIWYSQMPRIQLYHGDGAQETGGKCLRKEADLVLDFPLVTSLLIEIRG
jgi:hypothetical protein